MRKLAITISLLISVLASPASACIAAIELDRSETGWQPEIERADAIFSGTIRSIEDIRNERNTSLLERLNCAMPWNRCIYPEPDSLKVAEIDVGHVHLGDIRSKVSVRFTEGLSYCAMGPYREGLPIAVGQTAVFFVNVTPDVLVGWVPTMGAIEELEDPKLQSAAIEMFRQFTPCEADGSEHGSLKIVGLADFACLAPKQKAKVFKDQFE